VKQGTVVVSIVVPCYNEEKTIDGCIRSLIDFNDPSTEVIVVDDGSTDRTKEIVQRYVRQRSVRYIQLPERSGTVGAINTGIKMARGSIVGVLAGDSQAERDWTKRALQHFSEDPTVIAVGGPMRSLQKTYLSRCGDLLDSLLRDIGVEIASLPGTNMFIRADILMTLRLFDENFRIGEDLDISLRLGKYAREHAKRIVFDRDLRVYTSYPERIVEAARRHFLWGIGRGNVFLKDLGAMDIASVSRIFYVPMWILSLLLFATLRSVHPLGLGFGVIFVLVSLSPSLVLTAAAMGRMLKVRRLEFGISEIAGMLLLAYLRLISGSLGSVWALVKKSL